MCELSSDSDVLEVDNPETIMDVELEDPAQITLMDHLLDNASNEMEGYDNKDEGEKEPIKISLDWQIPLVRVMMSI